MASGQGRLFALGGTSVSNLGVSNAPAAGATVATVTPTNAAQQGSVLVWAARPGDASVLQVLFGAAVLLTIPHGGGSDSEPVAYSFEFNGDGATALTVKPKNQCAGTVMAVLISTPKASL